MPAFELVLQLPGKATTTRVRVPEAGLLIGRSDDCDIALPQDPAVSRHHARVFPKGDQLAVEDLGSRNGVFVGSEKHLLCHLGDGAEFRVGEQTLRVARTDDSTIKHAVIRPDYTTRIERELLGPTSDASLRVLFQASRLLGESFQLDALADGILHLIFEALPVRRGYMLTLRGEPAEPVVCASLSRSAQDTGPPLSRTLIDHVLKTRESVLIHDAQKDSRFDESASIIGHEIHSAMCVPLVGRDSPVGALYIDSGTDVNPFERADLELLTAIARIVGIAVENAQLHGERVKHERLAAIGEATAGLGHCIKNIMTGVRGSGEMISKAVDTEDYRSMKTAWPIMNRCINRIDTLVMNMLSYSRPLDLETMLTDMGSIVREAIELVRHEADSKKVTLEFSSPENTLIHADGREIQRVIVNLLSNAIEACERNGGTVATSIERDTLGLTVTVHDTGMGIPEQVLPHIFEAFYTTKGSRGTGLGLACCEKIVAQHGGRIDVQSKPGEGTSFFVFIPFDKKDGKVTQNLTLLRRPSP
ncbi:MAG: hypothetical protein RLZZ303_1709 [Candidatus Hydrogenedentota bacterium]|jgi:K+-sensing histidine kinase KdpD